MEGLQGLLMALKYAFGPWDLSGITIQDMVYGHNFTLHWGLEVYNTFGLPVRSSVGPCRGTGSIED